MSLDTHGIAVRRSAATGVVVVDLWPWARPDRRAEDWIEKTRAAFPSEKEFRREFLLDWTVQAGASFYPEWMERGEDLYVRPLTKLLDAPILRGWDFGHRFPACVWTQWDAKMRRLFVYRSILPNRPAKVHIPTASLRDLVRYLSGDLQFEDIADDDRALTWLSQVEGQDNVPPPPWFPRGMQYTDYSGHEALKEAAEVAKDSAERNNAQILESGGIFLGAYYASQKSKETAIRDLLSIREDGWPGLIVDPANWQIIEMFRGGLAYPKPTKAKPYPIQVKKDGYYDNIHDAFGYVAVNAVKMESEAAQSRQERPAASFGGRRFCAAEPEVDVLAYEGRG